MKPPFALIVELFLCCQMVSVIFIRKSIPSSTKIFVSMIFNHSSTEFLISYESVMDSLEILLLASFLQLISRMVLLVSRLCTMSMSMRSSLLGDILRDWKKVHRIFSEFPIDRCFIVHSIDISTLDDVLRNWKKVHRIIDEFLIGTSFFMQEIPARAVEYTGIPVW